ncbi:dTDP-4-amino-4,6-dideoxygalactose transaminase [Hyphomicrobiales bacterium]|nr:dTDP-4-amino-4,6-dideoxygalactose transaminase [Hyphomicrobiales bacterium]CAH1673302.1 dTDP-4-amino-4,6-dideoxygalactose transaminase [Hyphomicrobiales bacterium]
MAEVLKAGVAQPELARLIPPWPPKPSAEVESRMLEVVRSGLWGSTQGHVVEALGRRLAALHGVRAATCCTNGTIAIALALKAANVRAGDEVIVPAYTFLATASAPLLLGAIPVFAEIDPATLMIDPDDVQRKVSAKTRAVIPVHLAGAVAEAHAIRQQLAGSRIVVIEDAAQAIDATHVDGRVGTLGDMATLSFQTSKNVAAGEGGAVLTDDAELGDIIWSLHNAGRSRGGGWYQHDRVGWNLRMTEMQGVLADAMLDTLADMDAARAAGWKSLAGLAEAEGLPVQVVDPARTIRHARHLMPWQLATARRDKALRDAVVAALQEAGIPASAGYPPINRMPAIRAEVAALGGRPVDDLPVTEETAAQSWWLPQNVLLADEEVHAAVIAAMAKALG